MDNWSRFHPNLVPIVPPGAPLSPRSNLTPEKLGKTPGFLTGAGWVGFHDWSQHQSTPEELADWRGMHAGLGLICRAHIAVDIDITDAALADALQALAFDMLGPAPVRTGQAPKRLLLYPVAEPLNNKLKVLFENGQAIEILGAGQQFVIEGVHQKTGKPYTWDRSPAELGPDLLCFEHPTHEMIAAFLDAATTLAVEHGYIVQRAATTATTAAHPRRLAPAGFVPDQEHYIADALEFLASRRPAVEKEHGDEHFRNTTWIVGDKGVSVDKALEIMVDWNATCEPPWSDNEYASRIKDYYRNRKDEIGCAIPDFARFAAAAEPKHTLHRLILPLPSGVTVEDVRAIFEEMLGPGREGLPPGVTEAEWQSVPPMITFDEMIEELKREPDAVVLPRRGRFASKLPTEDENLPPLEFFDAHKTLPRIPGDTCVVMVVGPKSSHKTGLAIKKGLDAIEHCGARVLYVATEGGHGIGKSRLPAARKARGMSDDTINAHWRTMSNSFTLVSPQDRKELIAEYRDSFKPNLVVIDVLAKAVGGLDVNAPKDATVIMSAADELSRAFDATVVLLNHPKRGGSESIGSTLFGSLAYAEWHISRQGDKVVKVWVEKIKDANAQFTVHYKVDNAPYDGTPIINDMSEEQVVRLINEITPDTIEHCLTVLQIDKPLLGLSIGELANILAQGVETVRDYVREEQVGEPGYDEASLLEWRAKRDRIYKTIENLKARKPEKIVHLGNSVPGKRAGKPEFRWFLQQPIEE